MYERRLEHSLCRILGELRKERLFHNLEARTMDEGQPQVLLERLMGKLRDSPSATLRVERGSARYEETPCHLHTAAHQFSRQTNPISDGGDAGQVLSEAGVTDDSPPDRPEKTKPIPREVSSLKCQVSSQESQSPEPPGLPTSPCNFTLPPTSFRAKQTQFRTAAMRDKFFLRQELRTIRLRTAPKKQSQFAQPGRARQRVASEQTPVPCAAQMLRCAQHDKRGAGPHEI